MIMSTFINLTRITLTNDIIKSVRKLFYLFSRELLGFIRRILTHVIEIWNTFYLI
jgi:hypothetical protein